MNIRLFLIVCLAAFAAGSLSSCNTVVGMGRDIQRVGQGFENTAHWKRF